MPSAHGEHFDDTTDLYTVLGLGTRQSRDPGLTDEAVKKAYKKQALRFHPDRHHHDSDPAHRSAAEHNFKMVSRAFEVLGTAESRARYDRFGLEQPGSPTSEGPRHHRHSNPRNGAHHQHHFTASASPFDGTDPFEAFFGGAPGGRRRMHDPFELFNQVFGASFAHMDAMMGEHMRHHRSAMQQGQQQQQQQQQEQPFRDRAARRPPSQSSQPYDRPEEDGIRAGYGRSGRQPRQQQQQPLADPFFGDVDPFGGFGFGFGGGGFFGGGFGSMMRDMRAMSMEMPAGCVATSTSMHTTIVNGKKVTKTVRRTQDASGHVTEDVDEKVEEVPYGSTGSGRYLGSRSGYERERLPPVPAASQRAGASYRFVQ